MLKTQNRDSVNSPLSLQTSFVLDADEAWLFIVTETGGRMFAVAVQCRVEVDLLTHSQSCALSADELCPGC